MSARPKLTTKEKDRIFALFKAGFNMIEVMSITGVDRKRVRKHMPPSMKSATRRFTR